MIYCILPFFDAEVMMGKTVGDFPNAQIKPDVWQLPLYSYMTLSRVQDKTIQLASDS